MRNAVAIALVAFACLIVIPGAGRSDAGLIRIFAVTNAVQTVPLHPGMRSAGDKAIRGARLVGREGEALGYMALVCTYLGSVLPGDTSLCHAEYVLPRGKIVVMGTRQRADYMVLAVVGGTGIYSRASGVLIQTTISLQPRRERLLFSLES